MSVLPVQVKPSPAYPALQMHLKLSGMLIQVANSLHPPLFSAHSSTSVLYHRALESWLYTESGILQGSVRTHVRWNE